MAVSKVKKGDKKVVKKEENSQPNQPVVQQEKIIEKTASIISKNSGGSKISDSSVQRRES